MRHVDLASHETGADFTLIKLLCRSGSIDKLIFSGGSVEKVRVLMVCSIFLSHRRLGS